MTLRVWGREDVRDMLLAIEIAASQSDATDTSPDAMAFRAGFQAALTATAACFGLCSREPRLPVPPRNAEAGFDRMPGALNRW